MRLHLLSLTTYMLFCVAQVSRADRLTQKLPKGQSEIFRNAEGDATTTLYVEATRNGKNPIGILTSTVDTFINDGTTTEYMTQHMGTYIDDKYAKIESTSTREYYFVKETAGATGLVSASSNFEVHSGKTTEYTVHQYRTYIDGNYAHLVSSKLNIYSDPSAVVSATPVYRPHGSPSERPEGFTLFPREYSDIDPSLPDEGIRTRTIGHYPLKQAFENAIDDEGEPNLNAIRARSIKDEDLVIDAAPVPKNSPAIPTFTVKSDGELEIPEIEAASIIENEVEPETRRHRFDRPDAIKPTKTALDSVTYIGFVDFTTTIDDTVVIFRPKKSFITTSKNINVPKIVPTRTLTEKIVTAVEEEKEEYIIKEEVHKQEKSPRNNAIITPTRTIDSSIPERHRTSEPEIDASTTIVSAPIPRVTSGINPLKSLLAASASRRNKFNKLNPTSTSSSKATLSTVEPQKPEIVKPEIEANPPNGNARPRIPLRSGSKTSTPPTISSSIDAESDIELVYKTLYTTYTYFTTFFRASTTRIKSREDIVSNVVTLTNILKPSDLESLKQSCEFDSTCVFATSQLPSESSKYTEGYVGRPNTQPAIVEASRKESSRQIESSPISTSSEDDEDSLLKTFFTTYTYFTTLFLEGTSSVSTRTEVYSNIKSSGVPVDSLKEEKGQFTTPVTFQSTASKSLDDIQFTSSKKLEYSSIERGITTTEKNLEETITTASFNKDSITTINPSSTVLQEDLTPVLSESITSPTPELESAATTPESSSDGLFKTYYTTFTYFTTLFRNGTSTVTSNLETITNTGAVSPTVSSTFAPSVTFFTTFTYWTTLIDGDKTVTTSSEETRTDILPASVTQQIKLPEEKVLFTQVPASPSTSSVSEESDSETVLSKKITETSSEENKEPSKKATSKSNKTFTPAIRPNLIRPRSRSITRPREPTRTTVAIITRSDVTPTLIATPVTSPIQPTPTFDDGSLKSVSVAEEEVSPSEAALSPSRTSSAVRPTILSGLKLRRPNPFRERLRERQRQHLKKIRGEAEINNANTDSSIARNTSPPQNRRRTRPSFSERRERDRTVKISKNLPSRFSIPRGPGGRSPIFVSSKTETFRKSDESEEDQTTTERPETSPVPRHVASLRERARARINSLFRRRSRPANRFSIFSRNKDQEEEISEEEALTAPTEEQGLSRRKRQVSEFGTRTRARQTFVLRRRQKKNSKQLDLSSTSTAYDSSTSFQHKPENFDNKFDFHSSSYQQDVQPTKSSATTKRQVRQHSEGFKPRSSSRFSSRARQRVRSRNNNSNKSNKFGGPRFGSSFSRNNDKSTAPKTAFRNRFRPKTRGSSFRRTTPRPSFDFEYDYDSAPEILSSQQQNSVPDFITVTHFLPFQTTIPVRENGRNTFKDILTTTASLQVVAATNLKSTEINQSPVIYANVKTNTPQPGVKEITYEALRATETTAVVFTPTRIRGIRTSFSHAVPSTIYNIQPITTKIVEPVNQNDLLSTLLLQLLGGAVNKSPSPNPFLQAQQPQLPNLLGGNNNIPATQYITHTSTYVTTVSSLDSTVVTITLRGREIKTTLVESETEVVTATELITETIVKPTPAAPAAGLAGFLNTPPPAVGLNNLQGLVPDLKQQLLAAQLQQQLLQQQQQLQEQQKALLAEKLALEKLQNKAGKSLPSLDSSRSDNDKLVTAASSNTEDRVQKIVRVEVNSKVEVHSARKKRHIEPSAINQTPIQITLGPHL